MDSSKKVLLTTIGIAVMIVTLVGVTYSFFNYTRIGLANNIRVGRISFNTSQNGNINLSNVFPIKGEDLENDQGNHDSVTITITGDTTYEDGVEYLITFEEFNNIINNKHIPVTFSVEETNIGTSSSNYFNERGGETSIYQLTEEGKIQNSKYILAGYIAPGQTGINGTIEITAFVDADKIAISDTYDGFESDNMGTTYEWVDGRIVLTTEEWNSFVGNNEISFKVKVEANEGIWVEEEASPDSCFAYEINSMVTTYNTNRTNDDINSCVEFLTKEIGPEEEGRTVDVGETYASFCAGTGTIWGDTISYYIEQDMFNENQLMKLEKINIVSNDVTVMLTDYDINCGTDVIIPKNIDMKYNIVNGYIVNPNMDINKCVEVLTDLFGEEEEGYNVEVGETYASFCAGTGTIYGTYFQEVLDNYWSDDSIVSILTENEIIIESIEVVIKNVPVTELYGQSPRILEEEGVFAWKGINSVVIPNGITAIDSGAFAHNNLTSVIIPNSVTHIGRSAFFANKISTVKLPDDITTIDEYVFCSNNFTNFTLPSTLTTIDNHAFCNNKLTSIEIPNGVTNIGNYAFSNNNLTDIEIPNSVAYIGNYAFLNNKLTSVILPDSIAGIGDYAFKENDITSLTMKSVISTVVERTSFDWEKIKYINANQIGQVVCGNQGGNIQGDLVLGNRLTKIDDLAFTSCSLDSITIPNTVTSIGSISLSTNNGSTNIIINDTCSVIKNMNNYPWIADNLRAGKTIYGLNNEVCDSW